MSQLDRILNTSTSGSLVVSLSESDPDYLKPGAKKEITFAMSSIDALLIDNSGSLASQIMVLMPELRQPRQLQVQARENLAVFRMVVTQATATLNAEQYADFKVQNATAEIMEQTDALKTDGKVSGSPIDYSGLSGYSLRWSKLIDSLIELLFKIKAQDDRRKVEFMQWQTQATERSAKRTVSAGQNVLTGAISGAAINVAWTAGTVVHSAYKTSDHTKRAGKNLNQQQEISTKSKSTSDKLRNIGLRKKRKDVDKVKMEKNNKHMEQVGTAEPEKNRLSGNMNKEKEIYDHALRSINVIAPFGSSFERVAGAAGEMQASSNRAQSNIADNERSIHQKGSENSLDMESKTYKISQALRDLLLQLLNNTVSTNSSIINRSG